MSVSYVVLAAGKGSRLKSLVPKPFVPLINKSSLQFILEKLSQKPYVVLSKEGMILAEQLNCFKVLQKEQLGTGHAIKCLLNSYNITTEYLCVLLGDMPLLKKESIEKFSLLQPENYAVAYAIKKNPDHYGRIVETSQGFVIKHELNEEEKKIQKINTGMMLFNVSFLKEAIKYIKKTDQEYYITDLIQEDLKGSLFEISEEESFGINTQEELQVVRTILQKS